MKKLLLTAMILLLLTADRASAQDPILLEIGFVDASQSTFEVVMTNSLPIAGFQFDVTFDPPGPVLLSASGGSAEAAGYDVATGPVTVLGFSFSLTEIPPGSEVLTVVAFDCSTCQTMPQICLENPVISDVNANSMAVEVGPCTGQFPEFRRGDCNLDGSVNLGDAICFLNVLFIFPPPPWPCKDSTDSNDDGDANIADAVFLLTYLFIGGLPPPPPGPTVCGVDPTLDGLDCMAPNPCP
ncbi:MAG TPA: hypothetical protein EYN00_05590 [Planctomycetes bacterium]|nr:hypothetical protein [Planctomycetota bacterium]